MTAGSVIFRVEPAVFVRFPEYLVGCVFARNLDLTGRSQAIIDLLADAEARARVSYSDRDLKDYPEIAVWRSAFSTAGWSASRFPAAAEAIIKRVVRGGEVPRINDAVDLANAAVLFYGVPIGVHDAGTFEDGPLTVRVSVPGDTFLPLGDGEPEQPDDGEIVYACGSDIRTRRWVWRQSRTALVSDQATSIFFPIDGFTGSTQSRVEAATEFIANTCRETLGAEVETGLVDRRTPELKIAA